ncbi:MAG: tetratricopeptide repeat protein [Spirochaetes bacterium]|nr:tetratricopeptide repeat protein [Spirochaetota bacterium]MBU0957052.1 tetratricopeptide repeat protein [Spirochaetota bacterium]
MDDDDEIELPNRILIEKEYEQNVMEYERILADVLTQLKKCLEMAGMYLTYKARVKSFRSYFTKKMKFFRQSKLLRQTILPVTDMLAIRIICPFIGDLIQVEENIALCFKIVEVERKGAQHSFKEFGYESTHILIEIPSELQAYANGLDSPVVELQVRSILQDAWAEVEHELVYKAEFTPHDEPMKRKLAALNANLTLSDMLFQELRDYQHKLSRELETRRTTFFRKIEDTIDSQFFKNAPASIAQEPTGIQPLPHDYYASKSIDDLLLEALNAHNRHDYKRAIDIYSYIISMNPKGEIRALIYTHRGMACFAESRYLEALDDFSITLQYDRNYYKAAYYRGVVHSVLENYSEAIEDFNHALELQPYHYYSLYRRSQAYYHLGDYPKSLADCNAALDLEPENKLLQNLKAMSLQRLAM